MLDVKEQTGKISLSFFKKFLEEKSGANRIDVRVGPGFGIDVSIVDLPNGGKMAMASDPLSLIPSLGLEESAWLSVCLIANDLCTTGVAPQYGQFVLNLPADFSNRQFQIYWDYIHQFCKEMGIAITGGHTGFVEDQYSTIAGSGTFISIADKEKLLVSKYASPGDVILLTKYCGLSSAAILAMSFPTKVKNEVGHECYHTACDAFYDISVSKEAEVAVTALEGKSITAMHDVTEGGVLGAIYEMAFASGNGVEVNNEKLPINAAYSAVCKV
ncbi:MAG TPA: AIR synthase-related protein, partial [Chitinophagaceae bacterium]|nr:AIR synthase-related protein [Chitinophagaceae bacterium]